MDREQIMQRVVGILSRHARNGSALEGISLETNILEDLEVDSARLIDIVLAIESEFAIEIDDDEVDRVETVGDAVHMVLAKAA